MNTIEIIAQINRVYYCEKVKDNLVAYSSHCIATLGVHENQAFI